MIPDALRAMADARPAPDRWAALMYHELVLDGRPLVDDDPGYVTYCVPLESFRGQMDGLAAAGMRGVGLGAARAHGDARTVALTFDDGCETDWIAAAPILLERRFGATFFVIAGSVGRRGFLGASQLRELTKAGFEIGSHSLTHAMLTTLEPREVERELVESRARLEDATGAPVEHFSCPHGRWSPAIAAQALRAGYRTISTSQAGLNTPHTPPARLRRVAVQRGMDARTVATLARGQGLFRVVARNAALDAGKRILGEERYATVRRRALRLLKGSAADRP
jgi:peptidoglycan/xylan/chitin deacetylase (PgdA/CDA1 family)